MAVADGHVVIFRVAYGPPQKMYILRFNGYAYVRRSDAYGDTRLLKSKRAEKMALFLVVTHSLPGVLSRTRSDDFSALLG